MIFTGSNIDYLGNQVNQNIQRFCKNKKNFFYVKSLGKFDFLSFLNCSELFISNSSSGYYEAPSFGLPIIDLGLRQKGRIKSKNITNVNFSKKEILNEINKKLNIRVKKEFIQNPYHKKNSVYNTVEQLKKIIK